MPSQSQEDESPPSPENHTAQHQDENGVQPDEDTLYPNRPRNHSQSWSFHALPEKLFNPLSETKKKPTGPAATLRRFHKQAVSPQERKREIVQSFISHWRKDVGDDIYPALRLIIPDRDGDRAMYGLKERAIGKILVKVVKIDKNSEDGLSMVNWKLPGRTSASTKFAGDFAGRCFDILSKRPMRVEPGNMTIDEVNTQLDKLSVASKEAEQLPIFADFYRRMNPEELMWLIRIILRQMKIGATERTLFHCWHPDAENLFSICSSLKRVCWELWDPNVRIEGDEASVTLMQCFQPQLAQFQLHSLPRMVQRMRLADEGATFWIEEKMDGERMQLHMDTDSSIPGGKRFRFWSRKAKEYTYLYGHGLEDENAALTRHLKDAFNEGVQNIILDGEMIAWDPEQDATIPFGTLKTAALAEQQNPFSDGQRPLLRVFDILYLNGKPLTRYTLQDRRRALESSVRSVHRRFEIHPYEISHSADAIEPLLRKVVAEASEGLVLKNPDSPYRMNERHDDWMKVKPEYMTEFGESLDCLVIGAYYGSGHRGGQLASFLCGLRVDEGRTKIEDGETETPVKFHSFCRVGGGFSALDYSNIDHHTEHKWLDWKPRQPPKDYIELGGGDAQLERPDVWIKPQDSIVLCVKAASVVPSDQYRAGFTLRFPRLKRLRTDKNWESALSVKEFLDLKSNVDDEKKDKAFQVENLRKRRATTRKKKELVLAGSAVGKGDLPEYQGPSSKLFDGLNFYIITESTQAPKKSKNQLEQIVTANGGKIFQTNIAAEDMICVGDRRTIRVASIQKRGEQNIIRPSWIFDCLAQSQKDGGYSQYLLPLEPKHMYFTTTADSDKVKSHVDKYSDSYARDVGLDELRKILGDMSPTPKLPSALRREAENALFAEDRQSSRSDRSNGFIFRGFNFHFCGPLNSLRREFAIIISRFANAQIIADVNGPDITHFIIDNSRGPVDISHIRAASAARSRFKIPHIVSMEWIEECWKEQTLLDEERYAIR